METTRSTNLDHSRKRLVKHLAIKIIKRQQLSKALRISYLLMIIVTVVFIEAATYLYFVHDKVLF